METLYSIADFLGFVLYMPCEIYNTAQDWMDVALAVLTAILFWGVSLSVLALCAYGLFHAYDVTGVARKTARGTVVQRRFVAAHAQMQMTPVGNVMVPQLHYIPDDWSLVVRVGDLEDSMSVSQDFWNKSPEGTPLQAVYKIGRASHGLHLRSLSLEQEAAKLRVVA